MTPLSDEIKTSLTGALRLIQFERDGLNHLNHTIDGFWRSFVAALVALPLFIVLSFLHASTLENDQTSSTILYLLRYALGWVVFPLVMLILTRVLDRGRCYASYIISLNWMAVPQWGLVVVMTFISKVLGGFIGELLPVLLLVLLLSYDFFITRLVLELSLGKTALVVTIGILVAVLLDTLILGMP